MEHTLYVVGIGPGHRDYVVPKGLRLIDEAKYLVGSARALEDFARPGQATIAIKKLDPVIQFIQEALKDDDVVVMVSGDTGYYSMLPYLKKKFPDAPIAVIPGISSIPFAFARLGEVWQNARLLSFHGRVPEDKDLAYEPGLALGFLTDDKYNPGAIAQVLLDHGWPADTKAAACERLSYEDERIERRNLGDMVGLEGFSHSVLVVIG